MKSVAARYAQLETTRQPFLDRARECAKLTIPALLPPSGHTPNNILPTPYQAVGARGTNNLASKLLLTLLPPNAAFFKFNLDDETVKELSGKDDMRAEIEEALASIERTIVGQVEVTGIRVPAFEAVKQLLVAGNVLIFMPPSGGLKVFRLDRYVCKRDPMGNVIEIVVKESIAPVALPKEIRDMVAAERKKDDPETDVDLYTHVVRKEDKWVVYQEVKQKRIGNSFGSYPLDRCPWLALRLVRVDGEDYGRSYVEEYLGDLKSLEGLSQALLEGSAAAARVLFLVRPNSTTRASNLARVANGGFADGDAEDVSTLQLEKQADFTVVERMISRLETRLEFSFLLNSAIQRSGERVTAEEIRRMAQDLEMALGSIYALLASEFQLPLVTIMMNRLEKAKRIPRLPKNIKPSIVTGLEGLGRGQDRQRLMGALTDLQPYAEDVKQVLDFDELARRVLASWQVDAKGLIKSKEQIAQEQAQQMQMNMVQGLGPDAIQAGARIMQQQMQQPPATAQQ